MGELLDLAADHGLAVPDEFDALHRLTPFAVEYRYEFFGEEVEPPLDRPAILNEVRGLREWVERFLAQREEASRD